MRLRHHRDFFKQAFRLRTEYGQFFFLKVDQLEQPKIAVLLSKKKHGGAVKRNHLRRRLRAAFSTVIKSTDTKLEINQLMIAFYPNPRVSELNHQQLLEIFGNFLSKATLQLDRNK